MTAATERIEWIHPQHGRINETLCHAHRNNVLLALQVLGIGCIGQGLREPAPCIRCVHSADGLHADPPPREWIGRYAEQVTS